jgi:hypothetical protein
LGLIEADDRADTMLSLILIWAAIGIGVMLIGIRGRPYSAGLPLAYFLGLSLIHTPGAMLYLHSAAWDPAALRTWVGFEQTVIGLAAFLCGVIIARSFWRFHQSLPTLSPEDLSLLDRLALAYLFGGVIYFVMVAFANIPTIGAVIASLSLLLVVGVCLRLWVARERGNRKAFWLTIASLPMLPLITVVKDGFLGFGTYWVLAIVSFLFAQSKRRLGYLLLAPFIGYVGLSLFVNYMAARNDLRSMVWYQQSGIAARMDRVAQIFEKFEWLDFSNSRQREAIDGRLNQNMLVGIAAERLEFGQASYADGATIGNMLIALVPRALWPNKPAVGGGSSVVSDFTGLQFAQGTSVGAGQVLEFYVNFGTLGVIGGFVIFGLIIGFLDVRTMECLNRGDQKGFLVSFMMCLGMLQPGGNLLEILVTTVSAGIVAVGFSNALRMLKFERRRYAIT